MAAEQSGMIILGRGKRCEVGVKYGMLQKGVDVEVKISSYFTLEDYI